MQHPAIAECAIVGIPDKDYGEMISAIVVPQEIATKWEPVLTLEGLCEWARSLLAHYKVNGSFSSSIFY